MPRRGYRLRAVAVLLGAGAVALAWTNSPHAVDVLIARTGSIGFIESALLFVLFYVVSTALMLPASAALSAAAGFRFGFFPALGVTGIANTLAVAVQWAIGVRLPARGDRLVARFPTLQRLDSWSKDRTVEVIALLRLSPLVPFGALNYAAPARRLNAGRYALGTAIGLAPSELALVYAGSATSDLTEAPTSTSRALFLLGLLATVIVMIWGGRVAAKGLEPKGALE